MYHINNYFSTNNRCTKPNQVPVHVETLTPIDEEPAEDNEEDQPITMIPKIMRTAPSPTTEQPPSNLTTTIQNDQGTPRVAAAKLQELSSNNSNSNNRTAIPAVTITNGTTADNEVSQIESVL